MVKSELAALKCKPCEGGIPPMSKEEAQAFLERVEGWELKENSIQKAYRLKDFKKSMEFVNRVADLAEEEGYHPDIVISWNRVTLTLTTHAIGGLSQNDFILAAKIDKMKQMPMLPSNTQNLFLRILKLGRSDFGAYLGEDCYGARAASLHIGIFHAYMLFAIDRMISASALRKNTA